MIWYQIFDLDIVLKENYFTSRQIYNYANLWMLRSVTLFYFMLRTSLLYHSYQSQELVVWVGLRFNFHLLAAQSISVPQWHNGTSLAELWCAGHMRICLNRIQILLASRGTLSMEHFHNAGIFLFYSPPLNLGFAPLRDPWLQVCSLLYEICLYHAYHVLGLRIRLICGWTYLSS